MIERYATAEQRAQIASWFEEWAGYVRDMDYMAARALFDPDVVGFGTCMDYIHSLENLENQQWRSIWGTIADFRFLTDRLICDVSADGLQAWGIVPWNSTGFHEDGSRFERPGRATVLFVRERAGEPWRAIHTHISLTPGTPQRSHSSRSRR